MSKVEQKNVTFYSFMKNTSSFHTVDVIDMSSWLLYFNVRTRTFIQTLIVISFDCFNRKFGIYYSNNFVYFLIVCKKK